MRASLIPVILLFSSASMCPGQSAGPRVVPSDIHLLLPATLPPGPHPFVEDTASAWVFCDSAPVGGVPFNVTVGGSALVTASLDGMARAGSDTTYLWPNLEITALSTAVAPQRRTEQAIIQIAAECGTVSLPVTVTITDQPFLQTSADSVLFRFPGDASSSQRLAVWFSNAQATLPFTAGGNSEWLSASPVSGGGYTDVNIQVNPSNQANGDYFGSITLIAADAINSPLQIPVRMVLVPLTMWSQPQSLAFSQAARGPAPKTQTLSILTSGPPVSFTIATDAAWLSTSVTSGTTSAQIEVSVDGKGLAPGTYHGNIIASGPNAMPLSVPVTLTVNPENFLVLTPNEFNFFYWPGIATFDQVNSADMNITSNTPAKWSAVKSPDNWFYFSNYMTSGTTPYRLVIGVAWMSLNPSGPVPTGTFTGTITVSSPDATNSPQVATLHGYSLPGAPLNVQQTVSLQSQGAVPYTRTISVSADSPTTFTVSVPSSNQWLSVLPSSGTTPATLTFAVNTAGLQSGSYSETVTLYALRASGPPVPMRINVTLLFGR